MYTIYEGEWKNKSTISYLAFSEVLLHYVDEILNLSRSSSRSSADLKIIVFVFQELYNYAFQLPRITPNHPMLSWIVYINYIIGSRC